MRLARRSEREVLDRCGILGLIADVHVPGGPGGPNERNGSGSQVLTNPTVIDHLAHADLRRRVVSCQVRPEHRFIRQVLVTPAGARAG